MMDLKKYKLGDIIVNYQQGAIRSNSQLGKGNACYLKMGDLDGKGYYTLDKLAKTEANNEELASFVLRKGDFLINVRNSKEIVGKTCVIDDIPKNTIFNHMLVRIVFKEDFSTLYINALFNTPAFKKKLDGIKTGTTTIIAIYQKDLYGLSVFLPSIDHQCRIAAVLSAIDRKINLNRRLTAKLEQIAKRLYDYWFVQFDFPDENGKPYKSSGGKMIWNEALKREIPEGWDAKSVNDVSSICRGVSYKPNDLQESGVLILRGNNIENNHIVYDNNTAYLLPGMISDEQKIKKHDIIITMSSGSKEHIGKCAMFQKDSEHSFGAFLSKITPMKECPYFLFLYLSSSYFKQKIKSICNGTGINNLTNQTFDEVKFAYPAKGVLLSFERSLQPIFDMIGINESEINTLTRKRDELLPLLMNGQVEVE